MLVASVRKNICIKLQAKLARFLAPPKKGLSIALSRFKYAGQTAFFNVGEY